MDEIARLYGAITGLLCFVTSWLALVIVSIMIQRIFQAERKKERKSLRGRETANKLAEPSLFMFAMNQNVHFWNEFKNIGIVLGLMIAYLFLMVPYIVRVKLDQVVQVCIFVGSLHAVSRESTKILCSVQNDHTSKACTKVL